MTEHPGQQKTKELIRQDYWWPGIGTFVKNYVRGCAICQQMKVDTHPIKPLLLPLEGTKTGQPFPDISVDLIVKLPNGEGYDSILVVVDQGLLKGVILIPCNGTIDAIGIANLLIAHVYKRFGLYNSIISDRGPQFASQVSMEFCCLMDIKQHLSTAYHS
jgi:hypothetical protein